MTFLVSALPLSLTMNGYMLKKYSAPSSQRHKRILQHASLPLNNSVLLSCFLTSPNWQVFSWSKLSFPFRNVLLNKPQNPPTCPHFFPTNPTPPIPLGHWNSQSLTISGRAVIFVTNIIVCIRNIWAEPERWGYAYLLQIHKQFAR